MQDNDITVDLALAPYIKIPTVQDTPVRFGKSCHTSTDNWLYIKPELIGLIMGVANIRYYNTV